MLVGRREPGEHAVRVPAERRRAAEQRRGLVLAIPDVANAVTAIENSGPESCIWKAGTTEPATGTSNFSRPPVISSTFSA